MVITSCSIVGGAGGVKDWIWEMEEEKVTNLLSQAHLTLKVGSPKGSSWEDLWEIVNFGGLPPQCVHSYTFSGNLGTLWVNKTVDEKSRHPSEERKDKLKPSGPFVFLCNGIWPQNDLQSVMTAISHLPSQFCSGPYFYELWTRIICRKEFWKHSSNLIKVRSKTYHST